MSNPPDKVSELTLRVAEQLHVKGDRKAAADLILSLNGPTKQVSEGHEAESVLVTFRQWLLDRGRYEDAATLLWPAATFSAKPESVKLMWGTLKDSSQLMAMGAASVGKSFSLGVWLYLDWLRDPEFTNVKVVGPSEDHLEKNLFSHLVTLHQTATIPSPGHCIRLGITLDLHKRDVGIYGVVVPIGKRAPAKLQGIKVKPRPTPHPTLGGMSRLRVMLEEAEDIPVGIWEDVSNILSNTDGVEQFKIMAAFNPKDQNGACGVRCEPPEGWGWFDLDKSFRWKSRRGWDVVRLDGMQIENVKEGKMIFPGLQTRQGLERIIANAGGYNTKGYYTFARGAFPKEGADLVIIPQALLSDSQGEFQFVEARPVAGVEPEWCCVDRTVNGAGVHDYLKATWGPVKGVNPAFSASEMKILSEDTETPNDLYERLVTELWYAMRKFFEHNLLKIAPTVPTERLFGELTVRQFNTSTRGKIKVESKLEYKSRGHKSPDYADSLSLLLHGVRLNVGGPVGSAEESSANSGPHEFRPRTDASNRHEYLD